MEYPHCCPQFWHSKKNSNSTQFIELYFGVSEQIKPLQPIGQAAEFKFESKFEPLHIIIDSIIIESICNKNMQKICKKYAEYA